MKFGFNVDRSHDCSNRDLKPEKSNHFGGGDFLPILQKGRPENRPPTLVQLGQEVWSVTVVPTVDEVVAIVVQKNKDTRNTSLTTTVEALNRVDGPVTVLRGSTHRVPRPLSDLRSLSRIGQPDPVGETQRNLPQSRRGSRTGGSESDRSLYELIGTQGTFLDGRKGPT